MQQAAPDFRPVNTRGDDPAICYYTSGTTKDPKAVLHGHAYTWAHQFTGSLWLDLKPGRSPLDDFGYRLGEGRVRRALRPLDERHHDFHVQRPLRADEATRTAEPLSHHHFLRAADRISDAGQGGPRESSCRRCVIARARASRSIPRSSTSGGSITTCRFTTATARPKPLWSPRICPAWRSDRARWGGRFRASTSASSTKICTKSRPVRSVRLRCASSPTSRPRSCSNTGKIPKRTPPSFGATTISPATMPIATPTAIYGSSDAPTTSSVRPAIVSARSRSRARCSSIPP